MANKTDKAKADKVLVKANPDIVGYRIVSGTMSFLCRKVYNALALQAQHLGREGKGVLPCPVSYDIKGVDGFWWMPLSDLVKSATKNTRDYELVKKFIVALQGVIISRDIPGEGWSALSCLGETRIVGTATPDGNQTHEKLLLGWSYVSKNAEDIILDPRQFTYTPLSLIYQTQMTNEATLGLYEICKRYETMGGRTAAMAWEEWQMYMCTELASVTEYKFFKNRRINPAVNEINAISDITIKLVENRATGRGRPLIDLYFEIQPRQQKNLELTHAPVISSELSSLFEELEGLGVSTEQVESYLSKYGEEKVRATLSLTKERAANTALPALSSAAAYFKRGLLDDFAAGVAAKNKVAEEKKKAGEKAFTARIEQSNAEVLAQVAKVEATVSLPDGEDMAEAWRVFCVSPHAKLFKKGALAASYSDADQRQQKTFQAWWSSQRAE